MPPIFNALASIVVSILFISGCVATIVTPIRVVGGVGHVLRNGLSTRLLHGTVHSYGDKREQDSHCTIVQIVQPG